MNTLPCTTVDVCVITDEGYAVPTLVMLTSMRENQAAQTKYRVHFFYLELPELYLRKAEELASERFELIFHPIDRAALTEPSACSTLTAHVSPAALIKFRLPELLAELDKVLYLDGDIIVCRDLAEMYATQLGSSLVAAVPDCHQEYSELAGSPICERGRYFNSGVMLLNLAHMRKRNTPQAMMMASCSLPSPRRFMDQDAINIACAGETRMLPISCNALVLYLQRYPIEFTNEVYGTSFRSWLEAESGFALLHFAGQPKPWKFCNTPYSAVWMHYYNLSPFRHCEWRRDLAPTLPFTFTLRQSLYTLSLQIMGKLPLISVEQAGNTTRIRLLRALTLMRVEDNKGLSRFYLFGLIPAGSAKLGAAFPPSP